MPITVAGSSLRRGSFTVTEDPQFGSRVEAVEIKGGTTYTQGTGANQVSAVASFSTTIPAGQTFELDLAEVPQTAFQFGGRVAFSLLRELLVRNAETAAGRYVLWGTAGPSDPTGYSARIDPGGSLAISSPVVGYSVGEGNRRVYVANTGAAPVSIDVLIAGIGTYSDT